MKRRILAIGCYLLFSLNATTGFALDLDWTGQFKAESHHIFNYTLSSDNKTTDSTRYGKGYYIPGGGQSNAAFQTLFLKLRPSLIVNDNIYIKSEWWIGDPIYGFFGSGAPYSVDQRQFYSNQLRSQPVQFQRIWAELLTDVGTVTLGRAPLNWGLGVVWSPGNGVYDRYQSTGDQIRLTSKFGLFTFSPAVVVYSRGNNVGGTCGSPIAQTAGQPCSVATGGGGGFTDYSIILKYHNITENIVLGVNYIKRLAGSAQDATSGILGSTGAVSSMNYNLFDIYFFKRWGPLKLAGEIPIATGSVGEADYSAWALALEANFEAGNYWNFGLKAGLAPGQASQSASGAPETFKAFFFNPGYKAGLIMFNYQLRNFAGPNTENNPNTTGNFLLSPYDNPIANAKYLMLHTKYKMRKWDLRGAWIYATADSTASSSFFYNTWSRSMEAFTSGVSEQGSGLGMEFDFGATYFWDESFRFDFDLGLFLPGDFYKFSNTTTENQTGAVFAAVVKVGLDF